MTPMPRFHAHHVLLALVLLLATGLRFTGLGWGLRHEPHEDERLFVDAVEQMLVHRDLDHRFYQYPGLMFYLLAPVLALADPPPFGAGAFLAARALIAACGVLAVFLAWRLGRRLGGDGAGLVAALLLAVSPADVHTAHMLRPDVPLQVLGLLALLSMCRIGDRLRDDARAGAWLGAAFALKFSAVFLGPAYLVVRGLRKGPRARGIAVAALAAGVAFVVLSPYAVIHAFEFVAGARDQVVHHYQGDETPASSLLYYLGHLGRSLGPIGAGLLAFGAWQRRRDPLVLAVLAQAVVTLGVMSTADTRFLRHLVPAIGGLAVVAGLGYAALAPRLPRLAPALALLGALPPLAVAADYVHDVARPSTWDRAADWVAAHLPQGAAVLSNVPLGLDPGRHELVRPTGSIELDRMLARAVDAVAWDQGGDPRVIEGFQQLHVAAPLGPANGLRLVVAAAPESLRPRYTRLATQAASLRSSEPGLDLAPLVDADETSRVRIPAAERPRFVEVALPGLQRVARVVLGLGPRGRGRREGVELLLRHPRHGWERAPHVEARPHPVQQAHDRAASQVLLIVPAEADAVRVVYRGRRAWALASLEIDVVPQP